MNLVALPLWLLPLIVGLVVLAVALLRTFRKARPSGERSLILGTGPLARELAGEIRSRANSGYRIVGAVGEGHACEAPLPGVPVLGTLDELQAIAREVQPERIIVALAEPRQRFPVHQLMEVRICRRIVVEDGEEVYERLTGKLAIESLRPSSVIFSREFRPSGPSLSVARWMSVAAAAAGLIVLAPVLVLIAAAIKLDSRGPVLFMQERVGLDGRRFELMKFRTMHPGGRRRSEWARDNGDRITRVGKWLRKYRLDELPQFVNILRGDMNLIGPRPHPASNVPLFNLVSRNIPRCGEPIPCYALRSMVRPGITGWAQVRYRYANDLNEEIEKMRYDLYYIKHYALRLDLRILVETVKIVLMGCESGEADAEQTDSPGADESSRLYFRDHSATEVAARVGIAGAMSRKAHVRGRAPGPSRMGTVGR